MTNTEVAVANTAMLDRGSNFTKEPSVMDGIHKIKLYNANPFSSDPKEREVNEELVGKFRLVEAGTGVLKYIDSNVKVNILSVCKVKSGNVFVLDEFGDRVVGKDNKQQKAFFFTNEHSVFTKKTDMLGFKQAGQKPLGFFVKSDLEEMLRTKRINGKLNPFWLEGKKADGETYNSTHINDTVIIYGKFLEGQYTGEYFKYVPVSSTGYGTTYKNGQQVEPNEGTFLYAVSKGLEEWNKIRSSNGKIPVKSVDPSQLDMVMSFKEVEVQGKRMFTPQFKFDNLTAYREDNSNDLQYILELQSQYLEEEFGTKVMVSNFRLGSIPTNTVVSTTDKIEVKAIESKSTQVEEVEAEIQIEDLESTFETKQTVVANVERNGPTLKGGVEIPF